jgi:hypothetical protein
MRQLVAALIPKVQQCRERLSANQLGNALYALQCLGDSQEIRHLVAALTPRVQQSRELSTQDVGNVLCLLRRLGDSKEIRQLIAALTPKVIASRGKIELNAFRNTLYELKSLMSSEEVQNFLIALDPVMQLYLLDLPIERCSCFTRTTHEW